MEETDQIKEILINNDVQISDEELNDTVIKLKYLIGAWFDDVEREVFDGKTLEELLMDRDI